MHGMAFVRQEAAAKAMQVAAEAEEVAAKGRRQGRWRLQALGGAELPENSWPKASG